MSTKVPTRDEVAEQACTLRKQGLTYAKIAAHIATTGYKDRNGTPLKEMGVRHLIVSHEKAQLKETKQELVDEQKFVDDKTFKDKVQIVLGLKEFDADLKIRILEMIQDDKVGDKLVSVLERLDRAQHKKHA